MAEQSISCPSCFKKIPLTRALRTEIEASVKEEYDRQLSEELDRARKQATREADKKSALELAALQDELRAQGKDLERAREAELAVRLELGRDQVERAVVDHPALGVARLRPRIGMKQVDEAQ